MSFQKHGNERNGGNAEKRSVEILKVRVDALSKPEILTRIEHWIQGKTKKMVVTPNPEQVVLAQKDRWFREILNGAALALADGGGLLWASKILHTREKLSERVTGEEVMQELVRMALEKGWMVFLLGGGPGVAQRAAERLRIMNYESGIKNKELKIKALSGVEDITQETDEEREQVIAEVNRNKPDLLFVAYGAPWQEKWLAQNLQRLDTKVAMVVGGAFDMLVDPTLKPPKFMTRLDLDWLYRLMRQPWRIKRQLRLLEFVFLVLKKRFSVGE